LEEVLRNIRAEMARGDHTQSHLAQRLGVSQVAISKRLRGVVPLSVPELFAVAEFLDVPAASLLGNAA
jgi:transcriptional regulator with XRE-family HTH domain